MRGAGRSDAGSGLQVVNPWLVQDLGTEKDESQCHGQQWAALPVEEGINLIPFSFQGLSELFSDCQTALSLAWFMPFTTFFFQHSSCSV